MTLKKTITLLFIALYVNVEAQTWVEKMQDPNTNFFELQAEFNAYWSDRPIERGKGYKQFKRWEYMRKNRVNSQGCFAASTNKFELYKELLKESDSKGTTGHGGWIELGPFGGADGSGAGRLNVISFHPTLPNKMYAGAASGGIWTSLDFGMSWTTNTDELASLGISDIAINPLQPDIMYAATGDRDASDAYSIGVLKSVDGGLNWDTTGLMYTIQQQRIVNRLAINPLNPEILFAATSMGLFKTYDGGISWKNLRNGNFKDIKIKIGDTNTIFVSTQSQFFKSTNAGETFSLISIAWPSTINNVRIGITPADSQYVYVVGSKASDHSFCALFRSSDGGLTFTQISSSPNVLGWKTNGSDAGGQGWYDLALAVSPINKNLIFVGGVNIWRSSDGGQTWNLNAHWTGGGGAPYVHADIHELKFSPHNNTQIWASSDGGCYKGTSNGANWNEQNSGLAIGQIYRLGSSKNIEYKIMTGWQDNGSNILTSATAWNRELGGDGMECIIDYTDADIMYGSSYYGSINRTTNGGSNWSNITNNIGEQGAWITPYIINPLDPKTLIVGLINIWKSNDRGDNWTQISSFTGTETFANIAMAASDTNVIYASTDTKLYKTTNGGSTWTLLTGNLGYGNYTSILIHPTNADKIWISKSGFYPGEKVYTSNDGGLTWTNISANLPNLPANCLVYENGTADGIYVGMDVGVYYIDNMVGEWQTFIKGLPNVQVDELEIYYPTMMIRAATYGRGLWESKVYSIADAISENKNQTINFAAYPNPAKNELFINGIENSKDVVILQIMDSEGKKVIEINEFSIHNSINVQSLKAGIYFINCIGEHANYSSKFVKID